MKYYFSLTVSCTLFKFGSPPNLRAVSNCTLLETLRPSRVVETVLHHASIGVRCELWSATFLGSTSKSNTSLDSSQIAKFECEISYSNSAMLELSNDVLLLEVLPRKVALNTSSHLTAIEAWWSGSLAKVRPIDWAKCMPGSVPHMGRLSEEFPKCWLNRQANASTPKC